MLTHSFNYAFYHCNTVKSGIYNCMVDKKETVSDYQSTFEDIVQDFVAILDGAVKDRIREEETIRVENEERFTELLNSKVLDGDFNFQKVLVVVTTPKSRSEYEDSKEYKSLEKIIYDNTYTDNGGTNCRVELDIVDYNTEGLPSVYNRYMNSKYSEYIVCFIHDDVAVYDNNLYEKLVEAHKTHEVVGLAGATKINLPFRMDQPTAWHLLSIETNPDGNIRHQSGFVAHEHNGNKWSSQFGMVPQDVKIIDGLFMSFDVSECIARDFSFDEDFDFHHYDITASLRALDVGMNITTTDIFVSHRGVGEMDDSWVRSHRKFVDKYKTFVG